MKHFGDITKIKGSDVPLVDIVCGGSPCQDLSVAGLRAGLAGKRSGLFMEQIRIIKEMRDESIRQLRVRGTTFDRRHIQPRFMVWENVTGAFSSNKGEDFRAVLEETAMVADESAVIPGLKTGGRWTPSGCIMGDGWSIAWRVHDAQFWGVPQRRKRIALVADFGGESAPEILFEREGVPGDITKSRKSREGTSADLEGSTEEAIYCLQGNGIDRSDSAGCNGKGWREHQCYTLNTTDRPAICYEMDNERRRGPNEFIEKSPTITARSGTGGNNVPVVMEQTFTKKNMSGEYKNGIGTLRANGGDLGGGLKH